VSDIKMLLRNIIVLTIASYSAAFAPQSFEPVRADVALDMANGSKRKAALKALGKVAGVAGSFALATAGAPGAAHAAKNAVEVVETVDNTKKIVVAGAAVVAAGVVGMKALGGGSKAQDFLEAEPYWDQSTCPTNTYKNKTPYAGKVISTKRIVGPKATGETCHIIIDHKGEFPYWEGQSWGVIPPGQMENGRPHKVRLYSIASSRYGDDMTGKTGSLCVRPDVLVPRIEG
jgi:hypothetical protein